MDISEKFPWTQPPQDINEWRQHPENIPHRSCELEDGVCCKVTFDLDDGHIYQPLAISLPHLQGNKQLLFRVSNDPNSEVPIRARVKRGDQIVEQIIVQPNQTKLSNG